ncbi:hypothetical protein FA09DRAFT_358088 [Tilletiopsis washingtonensis]|uniref:Uncharacterized protein n=1 Tax=Tilletiopsis washingtonensis TaxID=58919 RepID=A0A316ZG44_9BASI|nr:hypothetical protein FA09DRAFT_358088 [Tilletiopsis washingtonensis]PWO00721.1 hypothetical protein FA09DRAFT_358088 [Tilletiopsis washingtonensis]
MSDATHGSAVRGGGDKPQPSLRLPPKIKSPDDLGPLHSAFKRWKKNFIVESVDVQYKKPTQEDRRELLKRYQTVFIPWISRRTGRPYVPGPNAGFFELCYVDSGEIPLSQVALNVSDDLGVFLLFLLEAARTSNDFDDSFTAETLEYYATVLIEITKQRIYQTYARDHENAVIARACIIESHNGVRHQVRSAQRWLIEQYKLSTAQQLQEAKEAERASRIAALRPLWLQQTIEKKRLSAEWHCMQAAQDDEDVRRIAELERNVPAGAELSFMELPVDVRARIMPPQMSAPKSPSRARTSTHS